MHPTPQPPPDASSPAPVATGVVDVSVVIVNYNVREFLAQALQSVQQASAGLAVEVFVVDNNSVDGSVEMVQAEFPGVQVIANQANVGFGKANNQAIRAAQGRYLFILNPDTILQEDTLATLVRFMDAHPEAGAVGCQILNPDGTFAPESRRAFPTPRVAFYRMVGLSRLFPRSRTFGRYNLSYLPRDQVAEVDALSGSCMLVRHAALHERGPATQAPNSRQPTANSPNGAGLFDETFFMYGEDLDWCYRIQQAGWKIYYTPATKIIHYKGESTKKGELRYVRLFYGAMLLFAQKHFADRYSHLFAALIRTAIMARAGLSVVTQAVQRLAAPLLDLTLALAIIIGIGLGYSASLGATLARGFAAIVAPLYAVGTVVGIALLGGYRDGRRHFLRRIVGGAALGLVGIAAVSFFVKELGYSRAALLLAYPALVLALWGWRRLWYGRLGARRAIVVGPTEEVNHLYDLLGRHPAPPFVLEGYVADAPSPAAAGGPVPRLGTHRHLRDLVRLRGLDDVVFVTDALSNQATFSLMQQLRDLPVEFRRWSRDQVHVIGKTSIDALATATLLERPMGKPRSLAARRALEIPIALVGMLLYPLVRLIARGETTGFAAHLRNRLAQMGQVLRGQRALIGYPPTETQPPPEAWGLRPGVFSITDTLPVAPTEEERNHLYWFYVSQQSVARDLDILVRALRNLN